MEDPYLHLEEARQALCAHFPCPLAGETLYSVCARFHYLTAVRRPALTGLLLFGSHRASSKRCVPVGLTTLVRCLPHLFASEWETLQQHTHASLYLRFMTADQAACATAVCTGPMHLRERYPFNWASARFEQQHPLRICPACLAADHDQHGYAYWHLSHQLPGAWVCPDHGEALHLATPGKTSSSWILPSLVGNTKPSDLNHSEFEFLKHLADVVHQLCGDRPADLVNLREKICENLEQAGVTQASRALNESKVNRWLAGHLGHLSQTHFQAFDAAAGCECIVGTLGKRKAHHPLRWAILIACLLMEGAELEEMLRALDGPTQPALPGFPVPRAPTAPPHAYTHMRTGEDIFKVAQAAGVTRTVVERWLMDPQLHALWTSIRLDRLRSRHQAAIHNALATGVRSRQELRLKAGAAYLWLQRNEPEMLERLAPRSREDRQLPLWS
jgi:hypothetical protein